MIKTINCFKIIHRCKSFIKRNWEFGFKIMKKYIIEIKVCQDCNKLILAAFTGQVGLRKWSLLFQY